MVRYLYKVFRENSHSEFEQVFHQRFHSESAVTFPFQIKPLKQSNFFTLYYIPTQSIIELIAVIYKQDRQLERLSRELPAIARENVIFELLVDELHNTNDLEGVRSSREEIIRSTREVMNKKKSSRRFVSMVQSYQKLLSDEVVSLREPADVRKIYDDITKNEIAKEEEPDGEIFRLAPTFVYKKSGSGKVLHQGVTLESEIIASIRNLIDFMNTSTMPELLKIAVGHYYFGYVHPFYDGNGRTSRFISSVYLTKECNELTALSLSRGCNQSRNNYLRSFEITNSIANRGEMNYFIETFFSILSGAQKEILLQLKEKFVLFKSLQEKITKDSLVSERNKDILFILAQNYFFSVENNGLQVKELAKLNNKSEQSIRSILNELVQLGVISKKGVRPALYTISENYF